MTKSRKKKNEPPEILCEVRLFFCHCCFHIFVGLIFIFIFIFFSFLFFLAVAWLFLARGRFAASHRGLLAV
jgi:hypothetical protein